MNFKLFKGKFVAAVLFVSMLFAAFSQAVFCADSGELFVASVDAIKNSTTLNQEETRLYAAEELWAEYLASGGSAEDAAVKAAYADYLVLKAEIESAVERCLAFMDFVETARIAWESYLISETKENMEQATALLEGLDSSYEGIGNAKSTLESMKKNVEEIEEPYIKYLAALEAALSADSYSEIKNHLSRAAIEKKKIQGMAVKLVDYPGMDTADSVEAEINGILGQIMAVASDFITSIGDVDYVDTKADILRAYELYKGVDPTANGVSSAKSELDGLKAEYDEAAENSNAQNGNAISLVLSVIF